MSKLTCAVFLIIALMLIASCDGNARKPSTSDETDASDTQTDTRNDTRTTETDTEVDSEVIPDRDPLTDTINSDPDVSEPDECRTSDDCDFLACINGRCTSCETSEQCATNNLPPMPEDACCGCWSSCEGGQCIGMCVDAPCCFGPGGCSETCESTCQNDSQCEEGNICIEGVCVLNMYPVCDPFIGAISECPFQFLGPIGNDSCDSVQCLNEPCQLDQDCPITSVREPGTLCVQGNCVFCWNDEQCSGGQVCRMGRWVSSPARCPEPPPCTDSGCQLLSTSESPCPVCICNSTFNVSCTQDTDCLPLSSHPFSYCTYGHCAECRNDADCTYGQCLPPGFCFDMQPSPTGLYGTWLIGWGGGMDHFSYFRFEPDGTLRRGKYEPEMAWSDDIPGNLPCWPSGWPEPALGTWKPEMTSSGMLVIRMSLNLLCHDGAGWSTRFAVDLSEDNTQASFRGVDDETYVDGIKVSPSFCNNEFTSCELPQF